MQIEALGLDHVTGRHLGLLQLDSADSLPDTGLPDRFYCLLAWDARAASTEHISRAAEALIQAGAVSISTWGPDCERVHDIIDEVAVGADPPTADDSPVLMTTWHDDDSLHDALAFFLNCTAPAGPPAELRAAGIVISVDNPDWARTMRQVIEDRLRDEHAT